MHRIREGAGAQHIESASAEVRSTSEGAGAEVRKSEDAAGAQSKDSAGAKLHRSQTVQERSCAGHRQRKCGHLQVTTGEVADFS